MLFYKHCLCTIPCFIKKPKITITFLFVDIFNNLNTMKNWNFTKLYIHCFGRK